MLISYILYNRQSIEQKMLLRNNYKEADFSQRCALYVLKQNVKKFHEISLEKKFYDRISKLASEIPENHEKIGNRGLFLVE